MNSIHSNKPSNNSPIQGHQDIRFQTEILINITAIFMHQLWLYLIRKFLVKNICMNDRVSEF